mmetsp:Transcript_16154/g.37098  ORF Transcript_16154/g.37098 Transcript_16154/m.37098 type:complete len:138 (-) Transcript_16154:896-1309(-)
MTLLPMAKDAAALGVGAFCGAFCRQQIGRMAAEQIAANPKRLGPWKSWHTAGINILGSFCLGGISQAPTNVLNKRTRLMAGVRFCGSFTTFSTYSVDVVNWISQGQTRMAMKYILTNNVGGVIAAAAGMLLVKKIFG